MIIGLKEQGLGEEFPSVFSPTPTDSFLTRVADMPKQKGRQIPVKPGFFTKEGVQDARWKHSQKLQKEMADPENRARPISISALKLPKELPKQHNTKLSCTTDGSKSQNKRPRKSTLKGSELAADLKMDEKQDMAETPRGSIVFMKETYMEEVYDFRELCDEGKFSTF